MLLRWYVFITPYENLCTSYRTKRRPKFLRTLVRTSCKYSALRSVWSTKYTIFQQKYAQKATAPFKNVHRFFLQYGQTVCQSLAKSFACHLYWPKSVVTLPTWVGLWVHSSHTWYIAWIVTKRCYLNKSRWCLLRGWNMLSDKCLKIIKSFSIFFEFLLEPHINCCQFKLCKKWISTLFYGIRNAGMGNIASGQEQFLFYLKLLIHRKSHYQLISNSLHLRSSGGSFCFFPSPKRTLLSCEDLLFVDFFLLPVFAGM